MARHSNFIIFFSSLFIGLGVFSFTPGLSDFLTRYFFPQQVKKLPRSLAQYSQVKGKVWRRYQGNSQNTRLVRKGHLHDGDMLSTDKRSSLDIILPNQTQIRLLEQTKAVIEFWNSKDPKSPVYLTIFFGDFELIKEGTPGGLYIVQDHQLFTPSFRPKKSAYTLNLKNAELRIAEDPPQKGLASDSPSFSSPDTSSPIQTEEKQTISHLEAASPPPRGESKPEVSPETLTNSYIESIIAGQKALFQKCQANAIRNSGPIKGQVLIGFTILNRGKVEDAKVLQSSIQNQQLLDCLLSVFKSCVFQEFTGSPILRSFPLDFE